MQKILVADDMKLDREILVEIFSEYYDVMQAADGEEACALIDSHTAELSLIVLDLIMPKRNGLEVLEHMRSRGLTEEIPVILLTGEATVDTDTMAYEFGAADIMYKPFHTKVVLRRSRNLIELYQHRRDTELALEQRTEELKDSQKMLASTNEFLLDALGSVVEFRSLESGEHVQRVKKITRTILECVSERYPQYAFTEEDIEMISAAAALHDVGKIAIPDDILNAPRRLTTDEFTEMKQHTVYGCEILNRFKLQESKFFKYCYDICRWHHEKVDGCGYPDGLKGDDIPVYCQAVSLADCFDALISKRVYKNACDVKEAYEMIRRGECGTFSEMMLNCFELASEELFQMVQ